MSDPETFEGALERAFVVGPLGSDMNFEASVPPTTGEEYLKRVILEARRCEDIVVAKIDHRKFGKQTVNVSELKGCCPPPIGYAPSIEWQRCQIADFSHLRVSLEKEKTRLAALKSKKKPPVQLPTIDDDVGWCQLCFGNQVQMKCRRVCKSGRRSRSDSDSEIENNGIQPLVSILISMSQPTIENVLEYHIQWLEVLGFSQQQGRWLYALLTFLEKPLTPETCSLLRTLARICSNLRTFLDSPSHPHLAPLNLLICLVAHYFDQEDLADS